MEAAGNPIRLMDMDLAFRRKGTGKASALPVKQRRAPVKVLVRGAVLMVEMCSHRVSLAVRYFRLNALLLC
jgi:hypothetical protein